MRIAVGVPVERCLELDKIDSKQYLLKLMSEKFNGYICVTIMGKTGIEEGVLLFHNGEIVSADYEYFRYNRNFPSDSGLKRCLNALLGFGLLDTYSLSPYQVQLIMTLNEECGLSEKVTKGDLEKLWPEEFTYQYEEELIPLKEKISKEEVLKRIGVPELLKVERSPEKVINLEEVEESEEDVDKLFGEKK